MRASRLVTGLAATAITLLGSMGIAPTASADEEDWGVNLSGTWRVFSDGEWARTNEVKIKQQSVLETWTVNMTCLSPIECTGEVKSSLGWTGSVRLDDFYYVEHVVPNWMPCPNGTSRPDTRSSCSGVSIPRPSTGSGGTCRSSPAATSPRATAAPAGSICRR